MSGSPHTSVDRLSVRNVAMDYPTPAGALSVLRDVSFELSAGRSLAVVGPSGSGKSTLLNIIGSLEKPTRGSVHLGEIEVTALDGRDLADYRARRVGFVFQDHHLLPQLSAVENVLLPTLTGTVPGSSSAESLLDRVGLSERAEWLPAQLSGGERQRVAIARALVNRPRLLLADEPTGNLDHDSARSVADLFVELVARQSVILIVVTHNLELARRFDRVVGLHEGRLRDAP